MKVDLANSFNQFNYTSAGFLRLPDILNLEYTERCTI